MSVLAFKQCARKIYVTNLRLFVRNNMLLILVEIDGILSWCHGISSVIFSSWSNLNTNSFTSHAYSFYSIPPSLNLFRQFNSTRLKELCWSILFTEIYSNKFAYQQPTRRRYLVDFISMSFISMTWPLNCSLCETMVKSHLKWFHKQFDEKPWFTDICLIYDCS